MAAGSILRASVRVTSMRVAAAEADGADDAAADEPRASLHPASRRRQAGSRQGSGRDERGAFGGSFYAGCGTEMARDLKVAGNGSLLSGCAAVSFLILLGSIVAETGPPGKPAMGHSYWGLPAYRRVWSKKGRPDVGREDAGRPGSPDKLAWVGMIGYRSFRTTPPTGGESNASPTFTPPPSGPRRPQPSPPSSLAHRTAAPKNGDELLKDEVHRLAQAKKSFSGGNKGGSALNIDVVGHEVLGGRGFNGDVWSHEGFCIRWPLGLHRLGDRQRSVLPERSEQRWPSSTRAMPLTR